MTEGEIAYLSLAIFAAVVFMAAMAWATHRTSKRD